MSKRSSPSRGSSPEGRWGSRPDSGKLKGIRVLCGLLEESRPMTPGSLLSATLSSRGNNIPGTENIDILGEASINRKPPSSAGVSVSQQLDPRSSFELIAKEAKESRHNNLNSLQTYLINTEECRIEECVRTDGKGEIVRERLGKGSLERNKSIMGGLLRAYLESMGEGDRNVDYVMRRVRDSNSRQEV